MPRTEKPRWWYCRSCFAIQDGLKDGSECWNCGQIERARKHWPWVETRRRKCQVCGKSYMVWILPPDTELRGESYELGLCRDYFKHYGDNAYFPPMLPLETMLEGNGWYYDEKADTVKVRRNRAG